MYAMTIGLHVLFYSSHRRAGFIRLLDGFLLQGTRGLSTMIQSVELDFEVRLLAEAVRRLELRATVTTLSSTSSLQTNVTSDTYRHSVASYVRVLRRDVST